MPRKKVKIDPLLDALQQKKISALQDQYIVSQLQQCSPQDISKILMGFECLQKMRIHYGSTPQIYLKLIEDPDVAGNIESVFNLLQEHGISFKGNRVLYRKALFDISLKGLQLFLQSLKNLELNFQDDKELCMRLFWDMSKTSSANGFLALLNDCKALKDLPIAKELKQSLYLKSLAEPNTLKVFLLLRKANLSNELIIDLMRTLVSNPLLLDDIVASLDKLDTYGFVNSSHKHIFYTSLISAAGKSNFNFNNAFIIAVHSYFRANSDLFEDFDQDSLSIFLNEGISIGHYDIPETLKSKFIQNYPAFNPLAHSIYKVKSYLDNLSLMYTLFKTGYAVSTHSNFFLSERDNIIKLLARIRCMGYRIEDHKFVYLKIFELLEKRKFNCERIEALIQKLEDYSSNNHLYTIHDSIFQEQCETLKSLLETSQDKVRLEYPLTYGPLAKSEPTLILERVVKKICDTDLDAIQMWFRKPDCYMMMLPNEPLINVSLLLRNANLSQIELSDKRLREIKSKLKQLINVYDDYDSDNFLLKNFSKIERVCFEIYKDQYYININKLFRNEPMSDGCDLLTDKKLKHRDTLLANFLVGIVVNHVAVKAPKAFQDLEERRLLQKIMKALNVNLLDYASDYYGYKNLIETARDKSILTWGEYNKLISAFYNLKLLLPGHKEINRGESLSSEIIERRLANPWCLPSVTSYCVKPAESNGFIGDESGKTVLEDNFSHLPVLNSSEGEVLLPHGTQIITKPNPDGGFYALLANSPSLVKDNHYWAHFALAQANFRYLNKDYEDESDAICLNGVDINRPNHGLANTYRVMQAIPLVVEYFAHHAADPDFKEFCQTIRDSELECLQIAAAFRVTGRESEVGAGDDLEKYEQYRESSRNHLALFFKELPAHLIDEAMKERLLHVVRYMGNPNYETQADTDEVGINDHDNQGERALRNFYHRILSIAHNLDLVRCRTPYGFKRDMKRCRTLSERNDEQQKAYLDLIRYNIKLIKSHKDVLQVDITDEDHFIGVSSDRRGVFSEVSSSLKRVIEVSEKVTRPIRKEPYQYQSLKRKADTYESGLDETSEYSLMESEQLAKFARKQSAQLKFFSDEPDVKIDLVSVDKSTQHNNSLVFK